MAAYTYIDLSYLHEVLGDDEMIIQLTVQKFLDTTPPVLTEMEEKLQKGMYVEFGKLAHKLKSSAGFLGMTEAKELLLKMEAMCLHNDNLQKLPDVWKKTQTVMASSMAELRSISK
ncbi:MAG: Hpt domain-containing protein [Bacteroidia bacterium]